MEHKEEKELYRKKGRPVLLAGFMLLMAALLQAQGAAPALSGKVISKNKEEVPFATVYLKGTSYGCTSNEQGMYYLRAPSGKYTLVVSAIGFETVEKAVTLTAERQKMNIVMDDAQMQLDEVVVMGNGVSRVNKSPFNAVGTGATQMAIFKGEDREFRYVSGLPASDVVSSFPVKNPYCEDGVCYISVVTTDEANPRIYKIDPVTAQATPGLTVEVNEPGAIGKLIAE